ncbi:MAG: ketopantoate reductase family protein [Alphaproteobacteria bacterium]
MHVLIVGAGAVGQVYGYHFAQGGAQVTFLVKPHHVPNLQKPLRLLRHGLIRRSLKEVQFQDFDLVSDMADIPADIDQVWLTMASDALGEDWLQALKTALPGTANVVGLQPGIEDDALLEGVFGDRALKGVIGFLAYQYPLPYAKDAKGREGIAYLLPPSAGGLGPSDHLAVQQAVGALDDGGLKIAPSDTLGETYGRVSALSITHMAALEVADWSFKGLRKNTNLARDLARRAAEEAMAIVDVHQGREVDAQNKTLAKGGPLVATVAPWVAPLPIEAYLEFHFSKVGQQTRDMLIAYQRIGRNHNLSISALQELSAALIKRDEMS